MLSGELHTESAALRRLPGAPGLQPTQGLRLPWDVGGETCTSEAFGVVSKHTWFLTSFSVDRRGGIRNAGFFPPIIGFLSSAPPAALVLHYG